MRVKAAFFNRTKFIVGNGNNTRFLEGSWLGDTPLALQYPSLYRIVQRRDALVATIMQSIPLNIQFWRVLVVDGDCPPQDGRVVCDDEDDDFPLREERSPSGIAPPEGKSALAQVPPRDDGAPS